MKLLEGISTEKKQNLERLLGFGTVMIFVDARRPGVEVPPQHRGNAQLPLNLDYSFHIPDFKILEDRIEASLSFNRQRYFCVIPFPAIYALSSKAVSEALVYPEDLPKDVSLFEAPAQKDSQTASAPESAGNKGPKLTVIASSLQHDESKPAVEAASESESSESQAPPEPKPKRGHLKLVE